MRTKLKLLKTTDGGPGAHLRSWINKFKLPLVLPAWPPACFYIAYY